MKRICISFIILLIVCFCGKKVDVFAIEMQGLKTEEMSESEIELFLENTDIVLFYTEPDDDSINCFDVNNEGNIAIGTQKESDKIICIYSEKGDFQYGYRFKTDGSFGLELKDTLLEIYFVRSGVAVSIDSDGNIHNVARISDTSENNSYWYKVVEATSRNVGDYQYILKNDIGPLGIFVSTYSRLYKIDNNGNETILYDVNSVQFQNVFLNFLGIMVFVSLAGISIAAGVKNALLQEKMKHQNDNESIVEQ